MDVVFVVVCALVLIAVVAVAVGAREGRRRRPVSGWLEGFVYALGRLYARGVHRVEYVYEDGALDDLEGPLLVVCNHTAGVDPILVSAGLPVPVRWLMADDMRISCMDWFWDWAGVIFIARTRFGRTGLRRARKHLQEHGVIGIFPEGHIERPAGTLLPFATGVGVLAHRTGARVLPVIIEGTPQTPSAWESLWTASRARVRVMRPIDYAGTDLQSADIAGDLLERYKGWTGWGVRPRRGREIVEEPGVDAAGEPDAVAYSARRTA